MLSKLRAGGPMESSAPSLEPATRSNDVKSSSAGLYAFSQRGPLPSDLEAKEAALASRLDELEATLGKADAAFKKSLDDKLGFGSTRYGGGEALARLDHETEEDRSWHDFKQENLDWALTSAWPDAPADVKSTLSARWRLQGEIDRTRQDLYRVRGEIAAQNPEPFIDGLVYDFLGMMGLPRPSRKKP
jgi:hypothetical protein